MKCSETSNKVLKGTQGESTSGFVEMLHELGFRGLWWEVGVWQEMAIPRARTQVQKRAGCLGNSKESRFVVKKELDFRLNSRIGQDPEQIRRHGSCYYKSWVGRWEIRKTGLVFERKIVVNKIRLSKFERSYWLCSMVRAVSHLAGWEELRGALSHGKLT